jgi:GTP-binding protein YchF
MKIGLVGLPGSGKTTVFNALTGLSAETGAGATRGKTNLGVVKVPDPRVEGLTALFKPKKKVLAEITFSDVAAGLTAATERGLDRSVLDAMREVDALCQVVRAFNDPAQTSPPDALREISDLEMEMILADLELVEKRIDRSKKEKASPREQAGLLVLKAHLDANKPLRSLKMADDEWALFVSLRFLSLKPLLLVLNVDEGAVSQPPPEAIAAYAKDRGLGLVLLSAKVEQDIAQMAPADQKEFVSSLGLTEPAKDRFIRAAFALLDLISFLTFGDDECRAWPIRRGTVAQKAAGKVHSDIERGFIRAEVIRIEDLLSLKTEAKCREVGKLRLEGKEYVIQDGDAVNFRFNV